jgi:hypothetical protein
LVNIGCKADIYHIAYAIASLVEVTGQTKAEALLPDTSQH